MEVRLPSHKEKSHWLWSAGFVALLAVGCSSDADSSQDLGVADAFNNKDMAMSFDKGVSDASDASDALNFADLTSDADPVDQDTWTWPQTTGCNRHPELCSKTLPEVSFATAHNAMSSEDDGWIAPNQIHGVKQQLADGIRGFMIDIYEEDDQTLLCHGSCLAGSTPLADWLAELTVFVAERPNNILVLILENYVGVELLEAAFAEAGLDAHLYVHSGTWPSLQQMIDAGTQVVVMSDREGGKQPWLHPIWTLAWETHWSNDYKEDFTCNKNRGEVTHDLFILNHFLTRPLAHPRFAEQINHNPYLLDRARECEAAFGHIPNFVTVDFYSIGDVVQAVDSLNGIGP